MTILSLENIVVDNCNQGDPLNSQWEQILSEGGRNLFVFYAPVNQDSYIRMNREKTEAEMEVEEGRGQTEGWKKKRKKKRLFERKFKRIKKRAGHQ